ncbi:MAG: hypothetical protein IMZ47_05045 [Firmicutes bacterium]|nr:hypothetical protein [Bacillota bacterium]
MAVTNKHFLLDIIEHGNQAIFVALLIFVVSMKESPVLCGYTIFMAILLLAILLNQKTFKKFYTHYIDKFAEND